MPDTPIPIKINMETIDNPIKTKFSRTVNKNLLVLVIFISIISLICAYFTEMPDDGIQHLDGTYASNQEIKKSNYRMILLVTPILGMLIGSIVSLIPFKKLSYEDKWPRFTLITILIFSLLILLSTGISFIRFMFAI